ncbi:MAG: efflux RND transporter permease subunit [Candidatus Polarisedimenticolaceae bacterium]|nr:efflux RND transporter permease subunit [Candidatus Polarisedimenticolaceae bacterium]
MNSMGEPPRFTALSAPIRFFAQHRTAANLLMAILLITGYIALDMLNTQLLPTQENPRVSVRVAWPGASASDMDKAVIRNLEPALRYLDGVDHFMGQAREGSAYMAVQFRRGMDVDQLTAEVQKAVDSVTTLPEAAERPEVHAVRGFERVAKILVTGPFSERELKGHAVQIRDGLLDAGIDRVMMTGTRDEEIRITVPERRLARHHLTMDDIATAIKRESQDRPAGNLRGGLDRTVHGAGRADTADEISEIVLRTGQRGEHLALHHVAQVEDTFNPDQLRGLHRGEPAIRLEIQRTPSADTLETHRILHRYIESISKSLPPDLRVELFDVRADYLQERINLLLKNGLQGLVIVVVVLFIFLSARIAFWVAFGIPVALMATFAVMWMTGQSINMFSLFALMLALGIIVDDAIVVGEHTATLHKGGLPVGEAVEQGALRMSGPVLAATLTTIVAFLPTFFMSGRVGDMLQALPLVVTAALAASLIECFFILPAHLRHALLHHKKPSRFRHFFDQGFANFRDHIFGPVVEFVIAWRYATLAAVISLLLIATAMVMSGKLRFNFFPSPEAEYISAGITMQAGTSREETLKALELIEESLYRAEQKLGEEQTLLHTTFAWLGMLGYASGDHLAQLDVQLAPSEERSVRTREIMAQWKQMVPPIAGLERFSVGVRRHGGAPQDLEIHLQGDDAYSLKSAALEVQDLLSAIPGVHSVNDNLPWGKRDVAIRLTQRGRVLGFAIDDVTRQVQQALEGQIVRRFARNSEEVVVRIRREGGSLGMQALREMRIAAPGGAYLPLHDIAELEEKSAFSMIMRRDGKTDITVGADLDSKVLTLVEMQRKLEKIGLESIVQRHGVTLKMAGGLAEQQAGFSDLQRGWLIALALIYIILAWVFGGYSRPLIVMLIIPFGIIGMVLGHLVMGQSLTMLSLVGLLGLSGIIINDAIILVSRADERMAAGESMREAATGAARDRLRAVLLTSLTTIGGLTPLMFETSIQAQFLLPMAITIVFGLAAGTLLVLLLVPVIYGILADLLPIKK